MNKQEKQQSNFGESEIAEVHTNKRQKCTQCTHTHMVMVDGIEMMNKHHSGQQNKERMNEWWLRQKCTKRPTFVSECDTKQTQWKHAQNLDC